MSEQERVMWRTQQTSNSDMTSLDDVMCLTITLLEQSQLYQLEDSDCSSETAVNAESHSASKKRIEHEVSHDHFVGMFLNLNNIHTY
jgi:hypothetical protein